MTSHSFLGNLCGDYGIDLVVSNNSFPICYPQKYYEFTLQPMESMTLHFWYTDDNDMFNISCQFWGSDNEFFPRSLQSINSSLIDQEEKYDLMIFLDEKVENPPIFSLDANNVQRINFNWADDICKVDENICMKNAHLVWLNQESCQFNLVCPVLQGDICKLAGLELSHKGQNSSVCPEYWTYQKILASHDRLVLTFWQTPLANFEMDCFAWCEAHELNMAIDEFRTLHINTNETMADFCKVIELLGL